MKQNRFNLIHEKWIPVTEVGFSSLREIFSDHSLRSLGGSVVEKIALIKLLLAIAQAACTPDDEESWRELGVCGLSNQCLAYLEKVENKFWLFGQHPFLQFPAIQKAACQTYGALIFQVATGNTTVLTQSQIERPMADAEKALSLVTQMSFALAGKKTDNSVILSPGYQGKLNAKGKASSGRPGPALGHRGFLHSFLLGQTIIETIWLNLLTKKEIAEMAIFPLGIGLPPWEKMPEGENCSVAQNLKQSLMGRLVPLCRFCLLSENGIHFSEGIAHSGYREGVFDPSISVNFSGKEPRALWVDPEKRPWRSLPALLAFVEDDIRNGFQCWQLRFAIERARNTVKQFAIHSGGLKVSSNAGEQFVSGNDDFVDSVVWLRSDVLGDVWFAELKQEMERLDKLSKLLYVKVKKYFEEQNNTDAKIADKSAQAFWQFCEYNLQKLVDACGDENSREHLGFLRSQFVSYVGRVYDYFCPRHTARQLDAWAKCRPQLSQYHSSGV